MLDEDSDAPLYNTAAVVQRTEVPATTIRAWERRYGYPKPHREPGGQRLYSERDIHAIRWLADQTARGVAISRAVNMLRAGHVASDPTDRGAPAAARSFTALRTELSAALLGFGASRAEALMAEAFALFSIEDVCLHVIEPLLVDVGDRWHAGEVSVAEEHYATAFIRARLFGLLNAYQQPAAAGALIFTACAPQEWHEVGILILSVFLARRGFDVRYLGSNLPLDSLAAVVSQHDPALVVLSAQSEETALQLRQARQLLQGRRPSHPRLAFGGQAFNAHPALRDVVDGTYVGPDAAAAVEALRGLVDGSPARHGRRSRSGRRGG